MMDLSAFVISRSSLYALLEIVEDYTSEAFVSAFHRFTACRGHCSELYSDQGTNFVGADKQLGALFIEALKHFQQVSNCSASPPYFGGIWEAVVKSAKRHLRRIIGEQVLTFVEYCTLLCRVEACLNYQPLIPLSYDASDPLPLMLAHFLIQRNSFLVPEPELTSAKISLGKRWELVSQLPQQFWNGWSMEYLLTLQVRTK